MKRCSVVLLGLFAWAAWAVISTQNSRTAREKIERISEEKMPAGSSVVLTEDEINSYLRYDFASEIPTGVSQPRLRLEPDRVMGAATVDFLKWQVQKGASPGLLLRWLLSGERPVEVVCLYKSANGFGQVDVESVKISGVPISAATVAFLIENLVQPRYPDAVVGRPVPLGFHLKQVRVERSRAVITR